MSQPNSTHTTENPGVDDERTRLTPDAPFTAVSIGYVIVVSISSGAMPGASVITTTVGAFRSGKMSTSVRIRTIIPYIIMSPDRTMMASLLSSENFIILLSIVAVD